MNSEGQPLNLANSTLGLGTMVKVVINDKPGGYSLSEKAYELLGLQWDGHGFAFHFDRANPKLVAVVEELGAEANGECANLRIVEVPSDVSWHIAEDAEMGTEWVAEDHRTWPEE